MSEEVKGCFKAILQKRANPPIEPIVDGVSGFLLLDKNDMPKVAMHWEKYFQLSLRKYNSIYKNELPKITPHLLFQNGSQGGGPREAQVHHGALGH